MTSQNKETVYVHYRGKGEGGGGENDCVISQRTL